MRECSKNNKGVTRPRTEASPPPEKEFSWTFFTQYQAVLPRKNINNPGPSIASPHPEPIKRIIKCCKFKRKENPTSGPRRVPQKSNISLKEVP